MISKAKISYLRITARKARLVADLIRGENVEKAKTVLSFTANRAASSILLLLNQAVANALVKKPNLDLESIYIAEIFVTDGPAFKRTFPRSKGRADIMKKRTCHITLVLDEKGEKAKKKSVVRGEEKKEEVKKAEMPAKTKDKVKRRMQDYRIKPKRDKGLNRFFRRKAM